MTIFPQRLILAAASALALSACQYMPQLAKPASTSSSATPATTTASASVPANATAPAAATATPPLSATMEESQNRWWERLRVGTLYCDQGESIGVDRIDGQREIAIDWKKKKYVLQKVATSTGAYRYEDKLSGLTLIQIPTKTILLNAKLGQRLADECNNDNRPTAAPAAETPTRKTVKTSKPATTTKRATSSAATSTTKK